MAETIFHGRAFWPGWTTSTRRCEEGFGVVYARSLAWFTWQGPRSLHLYLGSGGVSDFDAAFGIQAFDADQTATAEQGARANVHIGHASCYVT